VTAADAIASENGDDAGRDANASRIRSRGVKGSASVTCPSALQ
jgi:hypothetical protein